MAPLVEFRHVRKSFPLWESRTSRLQGDAAVKEIVVFEDLSFEIEKSEFLVILGRSGCGKTTLLRLIAGLTEPDIGEILINGRKVNGPTEETITIFQNFSLFPWRTVLGNVELPLEAGTWKIEDKAKRRARAREALISAHLGDRSHSYPNELSGGMQQRVALARGLVVSPPLLLMDEPFGSLDLQTRDEMQDVLTDAWYQIRGTKPGSSMVLVTHDIQEAIILGDRIVALGDTPTKVIGQMKMPKKTLRNRFFFSTPNGIDLQDKVTRMLYGIEQPELVTDRATKQ